MSSQRAANYSTLQYFLIFLIPSIIIFALYLYVQYPYLVGDFIYGQDDAIYVPRALFEAPQDRPFLIYGMLNILSPIGSITLYKLMILTITAVGAGLIALIFSSYVDPRFAMIFGVFAVSFPIDFSRVVFVIGAHATVSLAFILSAVILFQWSIRLRKWRFGVANVVVACLIALSIFASPTSLLMSLAHILWLGFVWLGAIRENAHHTRSWGLTFALVILTYVFLYISVPSLFTHYGNLEGWVDYSVSQILRSLQHAFLLIVNTTIRSSLGTAYILIAAILLVLIGWRMWQSRRNDNRSNNQALISLGFNALVASALAYGPISIVVLAASRYYIIPWTFLLIFAFCVLLLIVPTIRYQHNTGLKLALIIVVILNFTILNEHSELRIANLLENHNSLSDFADDHSTAWSQDAQIVVLGDDLLTTVGLNNWSTWYLRYLTGNENVIGLLGSKSWISRPPFVEQYTDDGDIFWEVVDGRSRHIRMLGLEYDRPTFLYQMDEENNIHPIDYLIVTDENGTHSIGYGERYAERENINVEAICRDNPDATFFVWEPQSTVSMCQ